MTYKCIIVDDEPPAIKVLEKYIDSLPQFEIVQSCRNAFEALSILGAQRIDLMFLDVHMPKLIGTDLLKALPHPPRAIFTTAHKDFAIDAFELNAIDYLLKPISFERFLKAVNKFQHISSHETEVTPQSTGFVYFRFDRKMIKVYLHEIQYVESFKDYIVIHRENEPDLKIKQTLNSVETMLPQHMFLRIHRSYIVAIDKITAFTRHDIEIGKVELPISKRHSEMFRKLVPNDLDFPDGVNEN